MTNKERIQENNAKIQECVDIADQLPNAEDSEVKYEEGYNQGFADGKAEAQGRNPLAKVLNKTITEIKEEDLIGVTSIPASFFLDCTDLKSVKIPDSCTTFGASSFKNCTALETVNIPNGTITISSSMFQSCGKLTVVTLPESVTTISAYGFQNCTSLKSINLGNVTKFYSQAFQNCALESIEINEAVTEIPSQCFQGNNLISVTIPNAVKTLGTSCFSVNKFLKRLIVGSGINKLENGVFQNCTSLEVIDFSSAKAVPTITSYWGNFSGVPTTCKIVVPDSLYDTWINATNWSAVTQTFVKASEYTGG